METLTKLQKFGLLEEYKSQFEVLANRVHDLPENHKLICVLGGLKPEIRFPVRMFNPRNLVDAYSLAKIQEDGRWHLVLQQPIFFTSSLSPQGRWHLENVYGL
jgi:hypothetical protein